MITQQTQIKVNLPLALWEFMASKAAKYDLPVATYVKHLMIRDAENMEYPEFRMSTKTEKIARKAFVDYKKGKYIKVDNVDEFFKSL